MFFMCMYKKAAEYKKGVRQKSHLILYVAVFIRLGQTFLFPVVVRPEFIRLGQTFLFPVVVRPEFIRLGQTFLFPVVVRPEFIRLGQTFLFPVVVRPEFIRLGQTFLFPVVIRPSFSHSSQNSLFVLVILTGYISKVRSYFENCKKTFGIFVLNCINSPEVGWIMANVVACSPKRFNGLTVEPYFLSPTTGWPISSI